MLPTDGKVLFLLNEKGPDVCTTHDASDSLPAAGNRCVMDGSSKWLCMTRL